jgi:hypothetical protein
LLVVLDDVADKENYKQFFGDLTGEHSRDADSWVGRIPLMGWSANLAQREAIRSPMRPQEVNMSSCSIWARGRTITWCSCLPRSRVSCQVPFMCLRT